MSVLGVPVHYDYDKNNRLTTAVPPNPMPDQPAGGNYDYDWVGNRLNPPSGTNHMVYNAVDQLTSWPGMHTYTYYGDGSLNEVKNAAGTSVLWSYIYSDAGLLEEAEIAGTTTRMENSWDADGNRVQMVISNAATSHNGTYLFVYDPTAGIPAVIEEHKTGGDTVYYYREPNGALIARHDDTNQLLRYYHFDALGSTRLLTDDEGTVTDKYSYDAWGSLIWHEKLTGSVDQPYQYVGELGYYTHYQDPDFKLLQLGVRFYNSEIGRFTQRDPAEEGFSRYTYAAGTPTAAVDPDGRKIWWKPPNANRRSRCDQWKDMEYDNCDKTHPYMDPYEQQRISDGYDNNPIYDHAPWRGDIDRTICKAASITPKWAYMEYWNCKCKRRADKGHKKCLKGWK